MLGIIFVSENRISARHESPRTVHFYTLVFGPNFPLLNYYVNSKIAYEICNSTLSKRLEKSKKKTNYIVTLLVCI